MKPTEQSNRKPSVVTGLLAALGGSLRVKGTGAPTLGRLPRAFILAALLALAVSADVSASASADAAPAGGLTIHSYAPLGEFSEATNTACAHVTTTGLGECQNYWVTATNAGSATSAGPIVLTDRLPEGFSLSSVEVFLAPAVNIGDNGVSATPLGEGEAPCTSEGTPVVVSCTFAGELKPNEALELRMRIAAAPGTPSGEINQASVTGTSAPEARVSEPLEVGSTPNVFGASDLTSYIAGLDGNPYTQAGGHPYQFTTRFDFKATVRVEPEGPVGLTTVKDVKDVIDDLPIGMIGDAQATPKCTFAQLVSIAHCPPATRIGQIHTEPAGPTAAFTSIYNMVPEHGIAAEFGFNDGLDSSHAIYASVIPTPRGYTVHATTKEVPQVPLLNAVVTFFGDPATKDASPGTHTAFFTNPSDCSANEPRISTLHMDSWQEPGSFLDNGTPQGEPEVTGANWTTTQSAAQESPPVTGCNLLHFQPSSFTVKPDTTTADSPTGLNFDLKIPQTETPGTLATPPLRNATVTLPQGLTVDPSAGNGLQACSLSQIGWKGGSVTNFTPQAPTCPEASKIGSVEVISPLIETTLQGSVYLAKQQENPFGSLLAGYIVIDDPTTGIIVKIAGELKTDPNTGQITGVFDQNPQLPFSELKLRFFGGPRGDLATPEGCGTYTTTSDLEPWSAPESGPDATPSDSFQINSGCVSGFTPAFSAGTTNPQAAGFSPFVLSLSKEDDEQGMGGLTVSLPPGLVGRITGVGECSESQLSAAQARGGLGQGAQELSSPSCPESSLLGSVTTATGPGPEPFSVTGKAYLTGPYKGAPYGIAVIVPAVAGPFDLGVVVIRQAIYIDPNDSHVTDISDPFPTIRDGIPLRIKRIDVDLSRPGFTLNPSSCEPKTINATATSISGARAALSSHYQATSCQNLPFAPKLTASAVGKGSKANGTTLNVDVTSAGLGQANIAKVDLTLPKALPSRLTTIQKACLAAVFEANPAACDEGSVIGNATIRTPLLPNPLTGPAYLVSHGGAAFPDVEFVLQGNDVTIVLDGKTDIKKGITYSRFESAPDAPFTTFETVLPAGPHSALTSNVAEKKHYSLCGETLTMPTVITGQNGAVITQTTKVPITGCPKVRALTAAQLKAQKLAKALKACHKDKQKGKRHACEKAARRKFAAHSASSHKRKRR